MYFIFSGEGPTDLGTSGDQPGPLALVADQIIAEHHHYSFLETERAVYVHPAALEQIKGDELKPKSRRSIRLPRPDVPSETRFHYEDARALSRAATDFVKQKEENDKDFVAVLFRDSNSPEEKIWNDKRNSMLTGFRVENIESQGVAVVARPISEAWWLSAIYRRKDSHRNCQHLESTNHGGGADHAFKVKLEEELETTPDRTVLNDMISNREIDYKLIDSESFISFRQDFESAVGLGHLRHTETAP